MIIDIEAWYTSPEVVAKRWEYLPLGNKMATINLLALFAEEIVHRSYQDLHKQSVGETP